MLKKMSLGAKITLGFAVVISINLIFGLVAVYNMTSVNKQSSTLAEEFIPEVQISNDLERSSFLTMYNMRGYGLTQEKDYLKNGKENLEKIKQYLEVARAMSYNSDQLVELKEAVKKIEAKVSEYGKLVVETEKNSELLLKLRTRLDEIGQEYYISCFEFLISQYDEIKKGARAEDVLKRISLINDALDRGNNIQILIWKAQSNRDPGLIKEALNNFDQVTKQIEKLKSSTKKEIYLKQIDKVNENLNNYKDMMEKISENWLKLQSINADFGKVSDEILQLVESTAKSGITQTLNVANIGEVVRANALKVIVSGLIFAFFVALVLAYMISTGVTKLLNSAISGIQFASEDVYNASDKVAITSKQLSEASTDQASSIEQTSASLEEIASMVTNNLQNAEKSAQLADSVKGMSDKGNSSMHMLVKAINDIMESNKKIQQLVKVIGIIADKTAIIDEIADQTNLLSINASIEAARAGEHGRGFAVVAQEVGKLAQLSQKAAFEISSIVKESIKNTEIMTTDNMKKVELGNVQVKETANILAEISENMATVAINAKQILEASREQTSGLDQINKAMSHIDENIQKTAFTSQETASYADQFKGNSEKLKFHLNDLIKLSAGSTSKKIINNLKTIAQKGRATFKA